MELSVKCNCKSYNWDGKLLNSAKDEEVLVELPKFMREAIGKDTTCIDACIVDTMKAFWAKNIVTRGCCCGHNKERPSVILETRVPYTVRARRILKEIGDDRDWVILTWELTEAK